MNAQLVLQQLHDYQAFQSADATSQQQTLAFVRKYPKDFFSRKNTLGHLTASAWVTTPAQDKALLVYHRKLQKWLQPGGHIEPEDLSLTAAALREAREETGLTTLQVSASAIFDLDVHPIPARKNEPEHLHYDIRFRLVVGQQEALIPELKEVEEVRWFPVEALQQPSFSASVQRMAAKSIAAQNR